MPSPFQKYQGEQVQQIPSGYVEAMGSAGRAYQQIGASISAGLQEADKRAQEEAKLQGSLAPYLKADPRTQAINQHLAAGELVKDEKGNVVIPQGKENMFNMSVAGPAIDFYNQTGGDGSKLTGNALTKFATQFEAQQKYDATQQAKLDKEVERQKTLAEIEKLKAEAQSKVASAYAGSVIAGFASGGPIQSPPLSYQPSAGTAPVSAQTQAVKLTSDATASAAPLVPGTAKPDANAIPFTYGFSADMYNAGAPLSVAVNAAPVSEAKQPVAPAPVAPRVEQPLSGVPQPTTTNTIDVIQAAEAQRTITTENYNKNKSAVEADYSRRISALGQAGAATPEAIKSLTEVRDQKMKDLDSSYKANIDAIEGRIKAATTITSETRATAGEKRADEKLALEKKADLRAVETHQMTKEEYDIKWGTKTKDTAPVVPTEPPKTFADAISQRIESAGTVPGRTGGTETVKLKNEAYAHHQDLMSKYPANWNLGLFHEGAKQYQFDLKQYPTAAPIDPSIRAKVSEDISGYSEAQTFLQMLNDVVNSTDDNYITNFLNRSLWTATQDAKATNITGDMMNQFGVAAFRRAIVSGGNFSDADREYVAKLITNINSAHLKKDKETLLAQTKSLANFIDQKYRAELAPKGIRFDVATSKKFLEREGDEAGLEQLKKTESYIRAFDIKTGNVKKPEIKAEDLPSKYDELADKAKAAGNQALEKKYRDAAQQKRDEFKAAAEQARIMVEKTNKR